MEGGLKGRGRCSPTRSVRGRCERVRAHVLRASVPSPTVSGLTVFRFHVPKLVKACLA